MNNNKSMYEYTKEILEIPLYMANTIPKEKVTEDKKLLTYWDFLYACLQVAIQTKIDYGFYLNSQTAEKIKSLIKKEEIDVICIEDCLLNNANELKKIAFVEDNAKFEMYQELLSTKNTMHLNEIQFMESPEAWKKYKNNLIYRVIEYICFEQKDLKTYIPNRFFSFPNILLNRLFPYFRINIIERDFFNKIKKTNKECLLRHLKNSVVAPISSENNPLNIHIRYFGENKLEDFQVDRLVSLFRKRFYEVIDTVLKDERINNSVEDFYNLIYNTRKEVINFYDLIYIPNTVAKVTLSDKLLKITYKRFKVFSPFKINVKDIDVYPKDSIETFLKDKEVIKDVFT